MMLRVYWRNPAVNIHTLKLSAFQTSLTITAGLHMPYFPGWGVRAVFVLFHWTSCGDTGFSRKPVLASLTPGNLWHCGLEFSTQIKPSMLISLFDASLPFHILLFLATPFLYPLLFLCSFWITVIRWGCLAGLCRAVILIRDVLFPGLRTGQRQVTLYWLPAVNLPDQTSGPTGGLLGSVWALRCYLGPYKTW